jgi:hypothetical protein
MRWAPCHCGVVRYYEDGERAEGRREFIVPSPQGMQVSVEM